MKMKNFFLKVDFLKAIFFMAQIIGEDLLFADQRFERNYFPISKVNKLFAGLIKTFAGCGLLAPVIEERHS